jgi:predicted dehydrogenase
VKGKFAVNRRELLRIAAALPALVPSGLLGAQAPSNKIVMGSIGVGWMGGENLGSFLRESDCRVAAIADVDSRHRDSAVERVNRHYGNRDCRGYRDFRELLSRGDIDAVCVSTPDHWHSIPAVQAARAGKDIYCEKPLSHTFAEGAAMVEAVRKHRRVWQTGSWQRSQPDFRRAVEIVLNGYLGKVRRVEVGLPSGHADFDQSGHACKDGKPPKEVDYDLWVGPARWMPFNRCRFHKNWRWNYNFGGGQLMDWIGHHCDIAHWGLSSPKYGAGPDDCVGPLEVRATAEFPPKDAVWNTATKYRVECKYPNDIQVVIAGGHPDIRSGAKWIGQHGWVWVDRGGFEASNPDWKKEVRQGEKNKTLPVLLFDSPGHQREFLDCVRSRRRTLAPVEVAHHSQTPGHLGYIASVVGRTLHWDPVGQTILDDPQAARLLSQRMRPPWLLG